MKKYLYLEGGPQASDWGQIYASSELDAARKVAGPRIHEKGRAGELRVRIVAAGSTKPPTCFYRDPRLD
jgi:hypothetical protein